MISIALVDDDCLVTELLTRYLEKKKISVVFNSSNGKDCISRLQNITKHPDIILLDLRMKEMSGLETLEMLEKQFSGIKIIVLSSYYSISTIGFMFKAGVHAFLPKGIAPEKLIEIILEVYRVGYFFTPEQVQMLRKQIPNHKDKIPIALKKEQLSKREKEVLSLICQQYTAKEIGEKLFIAQRTVEGHRNHLLQKTGAKNIAGLVMYAIKNSIVDPTSIVM